MAMFADERSHAIRPTMPGDQRASDVIGGNGTYAKRAWKTQCQAGGLQMSSVEIRLGIHAIGSGISTNLNM